MTAAAAGAAAKMPADFRVSITNAPGKGVYPISSFTWLLLYENPKDKAQAKIMVDFMKWALTDGQKFCADARLRAAAGERREARAGGAREDQGVLVGQRAHGAGTRRVARRISGSGWGPARSRSCSS